MGISYGLTCVCMCVVCVCVCLSITRWYCIETAVWIKMMFGKLHLSYHKLCLKETEVSPK